MRFVDAPIGQQVALVESMADERSNEVRCTYYARRDGDAVFSPKFSRAYRLRTIQGASGANVMPRFDTGQHYTETEVPSAMPIVDADRSPWGHLVVIGVPLAAECAAREAMIDAMVDA